MFSLTSANSVTKVFIIKRIIGTWNLLYERLRCYHKADKTRVTERIFKLTLIHASVILSDFLNSLNFRSTLGKLVCIGHIWPP